MVPTPSLYVWDGIQVSLISFYYGKSSTESDWTWILLIYRVSGFFMLLIGTICLLALLILIENTLRKCEIRSVLTTPSKLGSLTFLFYVGSFGISYFLLITGFSDLLMDDQIFEKNPINEPNKKVKLAGYILLYSSCIVAFVSLCLIKPMKEFLIESLLKNKTKGISMTTFKETLNLNIKQV